MRQQVVGLGDQLHVGVLDAVVDHLHEVAGAVGADVGDARLALRDRGDGLEDRAQRSRTTPPMPPGMIDGPVERALLAAGDAGADEVDAAWARCAFSRSMVSRKFALPPSTMMSPGSNRSASWSMTASVPLPACTMMIAVRGFARQATNSSMSSLGDEPGLRVLGDQLFGASEVRL